jgi:hypothetical protein
MTLFFCTYFRMLYKLDIDIRRTGRAHHFDLQRIVELVVRSHFCVCFVFFVSFRNRPFTLKNKTVECQWFFRCVHRLVFSFYYIEKSVKGVLYKK